MKTYSLCVVDTGAFTGDRMTVGAGLLDQNAAPPGFAWIEGEQNIWTRRVTWVIDDFGQHQPVVVEQAPVAPAESDYRGWAWDAVAETFAEVPKLKLLQANARPAVLRQLAALDGKVARPVGEIAQAQALGEEPPEAAVARLRAVNSDKQALRDRLAAIAATESDIELAALLAEPVPQQTGDT